MLNNFTYTRPAEQENSQKQQNKIIKVCKERKTNYYLMNTKFMCVENNEKVLDIDSGNGYIGL